MPVVAADGLHMVLRAARLIRARDAVKGDVIACGNTGHVGVAVRLLGEQARIDGHRPGDAAHSDVRIHRADGHIAVFQHSAGGVAHLHRADTDRARRAENIDVELRCDLTVFRCVNGQVAVAHNAVAASGERRACFQIADQIAVTRVVFHIDVDHRAIRQHDVQLRVGVNADRFAVADRLAAVGDRHRAAERQRAAGRIIAHPARVIADCFVGKVFTLVDSDAVHAQTGVYRNVVVSCDRVNRRGDCDGPCRACGILRRGSSTRIYHIGFTRRQPREQCLLLPADGRQIGVV